LHELNYLNGLLILNDEEKIMTTIIQGLKIIKHLTRKITTTNGRIARWCSYTSDEEPLYTDIDALIQSVGDMQMEICKIRHAIHLVNANKVVIFENKETTLDELLLEATVAIPNKLTTLASLRRKEKNNFRQTQSDIKVIIQYNPTKRDKLIDQLTERQANIHDFIDMTNIQLEL
jgi:hypothetical protein